MKELKIIKHTTYTYETSDGREFDDEKEAKLWQNHLNHLNDVYMLNAEYEDVDDVESAIYVYAQNQEQVDAFNAMQKYIGVAASIDGVGYWRYDDRFDEYFNIDDEIGKLQVIKKMLAHD